MRLLSLSRKVSLPAPLPVATLYRPLAFAALKDDELVAAYSAPIRKYASGEVIVDENDRSGGSYVILGGAVRISSTAKDPGTLAALGRGEWFGGIGNDEAALYAVSAIEPATVMKLSTGAIERLPQKAQNAIHQALLGSLCRAFRSVSGHIGQSTHHVKGVVAFQNHRTARTAAATTAFINKHLADIPSLPPYANDLAVRLLDETTTPQEVAEGIKQDPALAALILQRVNSSYFSFSTKVADYYRACLLLGMNNIYQLVLDTAIQGVMPSTEAFQSIQEHSFVVSLMAHDIARFSGRVPPPLAATVGLLHDLGKGALLMLKQRHSEIADAFDLLDDSKVGACLLETWKLPEGIVAVIENQNMPAYALPAQLPAPHRQAIGALYLAHACYDLLTGQTDNAAPQTFAYEYLADLGFTHPTIADLYTNKIRPELLKNQQRLPKSVRMMLHGQKAGSPGFPDSVR